MGGRLISHAALPFSPLGERSVRPLQTCFQIIWKTTVYTRPHGKSFPIQVENRCRFPSELETRADPLSVGIANRMTRQNKVENVGEGRV